MNVNKLFLIVLLVALSPSLLRALRFIYYHTLADQKALLRYELSDFHFARFFIIHDRILNKHKGYADSSDEFELRINRVMMQDEGYTDHQICSMELDAKNAAIDAWLKK